MQIMIVRTPIFDQYVLPVLKQQAMMARCGLEDYIKDALYKTHNYRPAPQTNLQRQGYRATEQAVTKNSNIPCLVVAADTQFVQRFNIFGRMKTVNKIIY